MSKKEKKDNSSPKPALQQKDMFNVKENLKKLRSGTGKEGYETDSNIYKEKSDDSYYGTTHKEDVGRYSSTSTTDRFEKINDKFNSDISLLKDNFSDHKEKVFEKINDKVSSDELKYWIGGIITGILLVGSIIYVLSYQDVISDIKDLKENKNNVKNNIEKIETRTEEVESNIDKFGIRIDKVESSVDKLETPIDKKEKTGSRNNSIKKN